MMPELPEHAAIGGFAVALKGELVGTDVDAAAVTAASPPVQVDAPARLTVPLPLTHCRCPDSVRRLRVERAGHRQVAPLFTVRLPARFEVVAALLSWAAAGQGQRVVGVTVETLMP